MKNNKLNLQNLKVKSFVTDFKNEEQLTIKGGLKTDEFLCTILICNGHP